MGFWGIEVKPGKPYPYHSDNVPGRLHVTQATLGLGTAKERTIVQCAIGHKSPIFLCSLLPNKTETCSLNLEFDEEDLVAFSVIGPQSVHLSGYFEPFEDESIRDDYESDSFGEDIADTESGSSEYGSSDEYADESDDDFIEDDGDFNMLPPSPTRKSGVIIEEIEDEEKPANGNSKSKKQKKKKNQLSESQNQIVVRGNSGVNVLESEDEDGFPTKHKSESLKEQRVKVKSTDNKTEEGDGSAKLKRKVEDIDEEGRSKKKKTNKKNKKLKEQPVEEIPDVKKTDESAEEQSEEDDRNIGTEAEQNPTINEPSEKKKNKKNKKKKSKDNEVGSNATQTVTATEDQKKMSLDSEKKSKPPLDSEKKSNSKAQKPITHSNGLVIEDLEMGQPNGKRASRGSTVSVCYTGKLMKNGKIFDSNVGRAPFKFRLGTGQVIKGWDVGVNGMRVGDKRRITIPPEIGYGSKNVGGKIPANSWLVFDVELKNVR